MRVGAAVFGLLMLASCKKSEAITSAGDYQTASCACSDASCVREVRKAYREKIVKLGEPSKGDVRDVNAAEAAAEACALKVFNAKAAECGGEGAMKCPDGSTCEIAPHQMPNSDEMGSCVRK